MMEHALHELPLALFTTLCLIGSGVFIPVALGHCAAPADEIRDKILKRPLLLGVGLVIVGFICSVFHLTQPLHGVYVFSHISSSPLSQELLVVMIFAVLMIVYTVLAWSGKLRGAARTIFAWIVAFASLVSAVFIARAYMIDTIPSWNTPVMIASLLGFLLLGAAVFFGLTVSLLQHSPEVAAPGIAGKVNVGLMKRAGVVCLVGGALLAVAGTAAQFVASSQMTTAAVDGAALAQGMLPVLFAALILGIVAVVLISRVLLNRGTQLIAYVSLLCALGAVLCARLVFYGLQISVGI